MYYFPIVPLDKQKLQHPVLLQLLKRRFWWTFYYKSYSERDVPSVLCGVRQGHQGSGGPDHGDRRSGGAGGSDQYPSAPGLYG